MVFAGVAGSAGAGFEASGAGVLGHLLQFRVDAQNNLFELVEFFRSFVCSENGGSYVAAKFVGNSHDSMEALINPRLFLKIAHASFLVLRRC